MPARGNRVVRCAKKITPEEKYFAQAVKDGECKRLKIEAREASG
jgi:hypothetical protein